MSFFVAVGNAKAFTLSPVRETLVVDPGQSQSVVLDIKNDSGIRQNFLFETDAFGLDPDTGHIQFGKRDEAKSWVVPNYPALDLNPGEMRQVNFRVRIPPGTAPGSHYLALVAKQNPAQGQVVIGERIASLLFLHVAGKVEESLALRDFSSGKKIYFGTPIEMYLYLQNQGTIHATPLGKIELFNWRGKKITEIPINIKDRKILPEEKWKETEVFSKIPLWQLGKLHARLILEYGVTSQSIIAEKSFWFFPWMSIVAIFIFLFGIIGGGFFIKKR